MSEIKRSICKDGTNCLFDRGTIQVHNKAGDYTVHTGKDIELEEAYTEYKLENQISYLGESDYGKCQSIEIPLLILQQLLNQPPFEVKEQLRKWYEYGQKTDKERETDEKS